MGAVIGFLATQGKEWLDAKRSKASFLIAVGQELSTIQRQLERSRDELTQAQQRFVERGTPPQLVGLLSTTVFSNQLGHLRNLSDSMVLEIVNFYSTLPLLEGIGQLINQQANEYLRIADPGQKDQAGILLRSALQVMLEEIEKYLRMLNALRPKLPS